MKKYKPSKPEVPASITNLRKLAEAKLKGEFNCLSRDTATLIHELEVHQIELEMQNEELRTAQLIIEDSRSKYVDLYDFAPVGYFTLDKAGLILEVNLTVTTMLGIDRRSLINKPFTRFIQKDDQDIFYLDSRKMLEKKEKRSFALGLIRNDKSVFYARIDGIPVKDSDGELNRIRIAVSDVTAQKNAEDERERLLLELERKTKELENVIYVTSHDLRSPIVNAQGYSKELGHSVSELILALQRKDVPEDIKEKVVHIIEDDIPESLNYIITSIQKMDSLISGLLKLALLGKVELEKERVDMNGLIKNVLDNFKFSIKNLNVKVDISELPPCIGDEPQLNQVFSNLVGNALKYLNPKSSGVIKISGNKEDGRSVYCVRDNGIGMPPEELQKIFEIFHQADPKSEGEGLGLSIVKKITTLQGGGVRAESTPGEGSAFYVDIPNEEQQP